MTSVPAATPDDIIRVANVLGEGIVWDSRREVLWWTDIQSRRLHRFDWRQGCMKVLDTPERVGSFGLVAGSEQLITAFASGFALYDPFEKSVTWIARPEAHVSGVRFNDGRVDRRGRFWSGTMVEDAGTRRPAVSIASTAVEKRGVTCVACGSPMACV